MTEHQVLLAAEPSLHPSPLCSYSLPDSAVITGWKRCKSKTRDKAYLFLYHSHLFGDSALSPGLMLDPSMTLSFPTLPDYQPCLHEWELSGARD